MPIIPDGVYKLHNDQDLNQVADLITGGPGPINGITHWNAHNDKVRVVLCRGLPLMRLTRSVVVKNVGKGTDNNGFTIESVNAPGIYAYAEQKEVRALGDGQE